MSLLSHLPSSGITQLNVPLQLLRTKEMRGTGSNVFIRRALNIRINVIWKGRSKRQSNELMMECCSVIIRMTIVDGFCGLKK